MGREEKEIPGILQLGATGGRRGPINTKRLERKLRVELTLGGKQKAGVEVRNREQETEAGRDKSEPYMNKQHLDCYLGSAASKAVTR